MVQDRGGLGLPTLQQQSEQFVRTLKQHIGDDVGKSPKPEENSKLPPPRKMLTGVNTQFRSNTPQLFMDIDRTKVASLGVSYDDVNQTLAASISARSTSTATTNSAATGR